MKKTALHFLTLCILLTATPFISRAQLFVDQKADLEYNQGNYAKALKLYEELAAQDKSGMRYLAKIADCEFFLKDYEKAEQSYAKYLEKNTSPLIVHLRYAQTLMFLNQYDRAREQLHRDEGEAEERLRLSREKAGVGDDLDYKFKGSPERVVEQLTEWRDAGVDRVMIQLLLHDDLEQIEIIGRELAPALA